MSADSIQPRRRWWIGTAALTGCLLIGAFYAGTKATTSAAVARQTQPAPRTLLTAPVVDRKLSQELDLSGTIEPTGSYDVSFGAVSVPGAQPEITQRPAAAGTVVSAGSVLAQIAGRPVFALQGTTPMYRDLAPGDSGPDVAQLQQDLSALGFPSADAPGMYGPGTQAAMRAFYEHAGYVPPAGTARPGKPAIPPLVVPQAEVIFIPDLPAVIESSSLQLGQQVTNPGLVLGTGSLQAVLPLSQGQLALISRGDSAHLIVTGPSGFTVASTTGRVSTVTASTQQPAASSSPDAGPGSSGGSSSSGSSSGGSGGGSSGPAADVTANELRDGLIGDSVDAEIVISSSPGPVLAVPVAAPFTLPDGNTAVTVIRGRHRVTVDVTTGTAVGGYVPVHPVHGKLAAGEQVLTDE
jgi:peptidoglycan hydrolase-like protein with peptidoglycan-binding domain